MRADVELDGSPVASKRRRPWTRIAAIAVAAVLAVLLIGPFLIPVRPVPGTVDPQELAYPDSRFVDVDGITVHYTDYGSRDATCAIVLLHGFGANTASWARVAPLLAEDCRVVAFDRPGFGLTERPPRDEWQNGDPYSTDAHADQTIALMDALGIERATLVGHSAGASVAVNAANRHPGRVTALVLEDPAVDGGGPFGWLGPVLRTPQLRRLGPLLMRRLARPTANRLLSQAHYDRSVVTTALVDGYFRPFEAKDWDRGLWEFVIAPRSSSPAAALGAVKVPTLVTAGRQDRIVPFEEAERVSREIPEATLIGYDRTGHVPHEERPLLFARDVVAFLRRAAAPASDEQ